ncbi:DUF3784 domain-containing protein [Bacillus sp. H-16]|uniref:DUF3784 domain-containing protein n=1 Tax=Alteribacter salitolerans TaxID=2912333 RepID=UPI0019635689|nr:DUF3784 domain-containing protein [Alteribacter salitolerans]MBM7097988.1 DUF3784 domain-containing protein [Alteribacter salitolerans]
MMLIAITIQLFSFLIIWIPAYFVYKKGVYMLLSGFNTKSKEEQQHLIENGYPQAVGKAMMNSSYLLPAGALLAFFVEPAVAIAVSWVVWMFYFFIRMIMLSKLDNSKNKKRDLSILIGTFAFVILLIGAFLFEGEREPRLTVSNESVSVTGIYGVEWPLEDIKDIALVEDLPAIRSRTNGYSFMERRRGHFSLEGLGRGRLFVHTGTAPFLYMEKDGDFLFVNSKDPGETEQWFYQIREVIE